MIRDYRDVNHPPWAKATIVEVLGNRDYNCEMTSGRIIKRHQDQIISFKERDNELLKEMFVDPAVSDGNALQPSHSSEANDAHNAATGRPKRNVKPPQRFVVGS